MQVEQALLDDRWFSGIGGEREPSC